MMGRKNKAEHINGGERLKGMYNIHRSEQGREDLDMRRVEQNTEKTS